MAESPQQQTVFRLADLNDREGRTFDLRPEDLAGLIARLELLDLRKVRLDGALKPEGRRGWRLEARLGATVVQPCVVTLAPVTTRVEEDVVRRYTPDYDKISATDAEKDGEGVPMPEDDTLEPLPAAVDLMEVLEEALALSLPMYPRADGADLGEAQFTEKGVAPLKDEDLKPFAGLAALRDKMGAKDGEEE
ncbi:YceD family protein [Pseudooceanicola onchidii]|uniref:YceD family protein n=1 Tax=Pseudooceanicola onchidii TaxID=2562279 RepID=UPI0010AAD4D2|nr:DUF177 domain-containing protein [Pseudooceanicola onchidii]